MIENHPPPTQLGEVTQHDGPVRADLVTAELTVAGFADAREIGRGGFGVVFRCSQPALDRVVAVKVLTGEFDSENLARFLREQRAMGRLTGHPNILNVLSVGATSSGRPYIVMPYHLQGSMAAWIHAHGRFECEAACRLGIKVAGALETAHRAGILHRDVKPANVLLSDYGEPELADFGIAHVNGYRNDRPRVHVVDAFETAKGIVTGSPAFTAPEILRGDQSDAAADIYSLGATLLAAISGRQVPDVATEPDLPHDLRVVLEHAMAVYPGDRPTSAAEFGEELRQTQRRRGWSLDEMALSPELGDPNSNSSKPRTSFAPPRGTDPVSGNASTRGRDDMGNLPLDLTSFVGRRRELTETKKALAANRLVTLAGVGGVGKTRLALQVARSCRQAFPDGVWLVELGEIRDEPLVAETVTASLGLRNLSARPVQQTLVEHLRPHRTLLVLDNCEQMLDAIAALAQALLQTCPELRILATSREPLGIGGESVLRLSPLTVPDHDQTPSLQGLSGYDAVTLFIERACAVLPTFAITEDNRASVTQICHQLDGLPLPIELAAARLRSMSTTQILEHLTDRYRLLTGGNRTAPTRQQTLQLCMDWSYELCTPLEQKLWARLSVFTGGFELDAVEGICADELTSADVLDVLVSLIDKSILIREEPTSVVRYRFLETLREYGAEKLKECGEAGQLQRRHREWFEQLALRAAAEWIGPNQLDWIDRLGREQPNLHEAMELCISESGVDHTEAGLRMAVAIFPFWFSRGLFSEARHWFDRILACDSETPTVARLEALYADCRLASIQGDTEAGAALAEEARASAESLGSPDADALASYACGVLALFSGNPKQAVTDISHAFEVFRPEDNLLRHVWALNHLGLAYHQIGDTSRAIECYEESLSITEPLGEIVYRGRSCWNLGLALWSDGNQARAESQLKKGLTLARLVDDPFGSAWCMEVLAWIAADAKRYGHAAALMGAVQTLLDEIDTPAIRVLGMTANHEECARVSKLQLGARKFDTEFKKGAKLKISEATALALDENPPVTVPSNQIGPSLTKRESEVADLVAQGLTNKAIAAKLVISIRTAQGHVEHILTKLGFSSRAQIAGWVVEQARNVT
ncbi:protein kinase [Rhodococcus sp. IEGM 1366]|uniref:protein kinase domain-containing protein n=1 Tax=Rhodococcus sp. IEGM 1366 TaxID=3082223 RepID=UPI002954F89D|nr:protein kinase [Rhodococcus sp. IEGM 1366]MDV8066733.1 protein kinase [Rhodococcus sp. IEGM 1366]